MCSAGVLRLGALRGLESGVFHDAGTHFSAQLVKMRLNGIRLTNTLMNLRPCVTNGSSIYSIIASLCKCLSLEFNKVSAERNAAVVSLAHTTVKHSMALYFLFMACIYF